MYVSRIKLSVEIACRNRVSRCVRGIDVERSKQLLLDIVKYLNKLCVRLLTNRKVDLILCSVDELFSFS